MNYDDKRAMLSSAMYSLDLEVLNLNVLQSGMKLDPAISTALLGVMSSAIDLIKAASAIRQDS